MNLIDYIIWRGDISFKTDSLNDIDNIIFSELAYADFEGIVPPPESKEKIYLRDAIKKYFLRHKKDKENLSLLEKKILPMLKEMKNTERYSHCLLSCYVSDISKGEEVQFSALQIEMEDGSLYVSFSGTDHTMIGWKENFNMSYLEETPGQKRAAAYIAENIPRYREKLYLGGHSKGGNLAAYACTYAPKEIQKHIIKAYNNDGPGLSKKVIESKEYDRIKDKVCTILPQASVFGLLFEQPDKIQVVHSNNWGIIQHDIFSWEVRGKNFVQDDGINEDSIILNESVSEFVSELDLEERKQFVESLFLVIEKAGIEHTEQLIKINPKTLIDIVRASKQIEESQKGTILKTIRLFIKTFGQNVVEQKIHLKKKMEIQE